MCARPNCAPVLRQSLNFQRFASGYRLCLFYPNPLVPTFTPVGLTGMGAAWIGPLSFDGLVFVLTARKYLAARRASRTVAHDILDVVTRNGTVAFFTSSMTLLTESSKYSFRILRVSSMLVSPLLYT